MHVLLFHTIHIICSCLESISISGFLPSVYCNLCICASQLEIKFSRSVVSDSATPWTSAHQASLSITSSWSLLKSMSTELVMLSNYLILCCPLLLLPSVFPSIRVFSKSQFFAPGGQSIEVSVSASVFQ